ncbi:CPBP family intramembrane glutamic endopeptidase [Paenibacillus thalictri]|uniref:CPBP family intramembrane metalloprotease n=1 Tax=Paenibacillus thalictri TaxID=2527873 RepID=A0A4Q9DV03_9BACL|nr:type II CAAX endopeptidase family protein [Paenibacillus thalictri]TBL79780.1 CPBP family intramembrane metalloprotease [Paenibacillus thalictri]
MKKFNFNQFKLKKVNIDDLDDRLLLINLYGTQGFILLVALIIFLFQKRNPLQLLAPHSWGAIAGWSILFAAAVLIVDMAITRWVPEEVTDDGGINDKLFGNRPLWHIAVISLFVSICEEMLFRGAIQEAWGAYWTSILFAAIHIRYLQHWLMTGLVFGISYGLGWIYVHTGTIWTPIAAHFIIDLTMGCILRFRREK